MLCGTSPGHLLLLEDDATVRETVREALEREGWTVALAENGRVGLERLAEQRPDAILLDLMMPEMDGFEFLAVLRQQADWRHVPVVVVTALELSALDRERLNGEVVQVITKSGQARDELVREVAEAVVASVRRAQRVDQGAPASGTAKD